MTAGPNIVILAREFHCLGVVVRCSSSPIITPSGFDGKSLGAATEAVETSFRTLVNKMDQHSEFEDSQLFRFFSKYLSDIRDDIR